MKKIINTIVILLICITPVHFSAQSEHDQAADSNVVIESLKIQNRELDKVILEKAKQEPIVRTIHVTKPAPDIERVYLRMDGIMYEFDIERIKGMLIIDVDSLYATTLEQDNYKGNIFERIFYRKINK